MDKDDLDALHILKIDILALGMLTCIRKSFCADRAALWPALHPRDDPAEHQLVYEC